MFVSFDPDQGSNLSAPSRGIVSCGPVSCTSSFVAHGEGMKLQLGSSCSSGTMSAAWIPRSAPMLEIAETNEQGDELIEDGSNVVIPR